MNNQRSIHQIDGLNNVLIDGFQLASKTVSTTATADASNVVQRYFLTHYHSDHYKGLKPSWNKGLIYCSTTTAKLLINVMLVRKEWVYGVEVNETITIGTNRGNIDVTFIDANHCPGAVLLLFKIDEETYHLHTGDMRYSPKMKIDPLLAMVRGKVDKLYLDTTYAHPRHCFQSQDDSIVQIVQQTREFFASHGVERSIVYLSAYTIGKEKVIFAVCDELKLPIYMDDDKLLIMRQIEGGIERIEQGLFVSDPTLAHIHICKMGFAGSLHPFFKPHFENIAANIEHLNSLLQATTTSRDAETADVVVTIEHSLAFIPSGWADSGNFNRRHSTALRDSSTVQLIAYSEHSQCNELMEFVGFLRPKQVVPTVFSDDKQRVSMLDMFAPLLDRRDSVRRFFMRFPHYSSLKKNDDDNEVEWRDDGCLAESVGSDHSLVHVVDDDDDDVTGLSSCSRRSILPFDASSSFDRQPNMPTHKQKLTSTRASKKSKMTHDSTKAVTANQVPSVTTCITYISRSPWQCVACTFKHSSPATIDYLQCSVCFTPRTAGVPSPPMMLQESNSMIDRIHISQE